MVEGSGGARRVDLAVVGGGIVGAAVAHYAAAAGLAVALFERDALNSGGTRATAGNLHIQGNRPRLGVEGGLCEMPLFLPLQRVAGALWRELGAELGEDLGLVQSGGLMVAETPEEVRLLEAKHACELAHGLGTELLGGDEARRRLPALSEAVLAAGYCADDGYADPLKATPALAASAARRGARVLTGRAVRSLESDPQGGYRLATDGCSWVARWVVDAAGAGARDVARMVGVDLALEPRPSQVHATTRGRPEMRGQLVQHVGRRLSVKQTAEGNAVIGGGWPGLAGPDGRCEPRLSSAVANLRPASRILPFLGGLPLLRAWAGLLPGTRDNLPVCGEISARPGFHVAFSTFGFTLAPLFGFCLVERMLGRESPVDLRALGPDRLVE